MNYHTFHSVAIALDFDVRTIIVLGEGRRCFLCFDIVS